MAISVYDFILLWFSISVAMLLIDTFYWFGYLRQHGSRISFFLSGTPGVVESSYLKLARENLIATGPFLRRRVFVYGNCGLALVAFILKDNPIDWEIPIW